MTSIPTPPPTAQDTPQGAPARVAGRPSVWRRMGRSLWILPAGVLTALFLILPAIMTGVLSVRPGNAFDVQTIFTGEISFQHYEAILTAPDTLETFITTIMYVIGAVVPSAAIGLWIALLVDRPFRSKGWAQAALLLPWGVPGVVVSIGFGWMLNESFGVVNALLLDLGVIDERIGWLTSVRYAMFGVLLPTIWKTFPFVVLTLIAALKSIPDELYEAASVDGATTLQTLRHITLPAVRAPLALAVVMTSLLSFKEFDFIYPLTQGGPADATETLAIRVYNEAFDFFRLERAAAWGIITMVVGALVVAAGYRWLKDEYF